MINITFTVHIPTADANVDDSTIRTMKYLLLSLLILLSLYSATSSIVETGLRLMTVSNSCTATVDNTNDFYAGNASLCAPSAGQCTLRSALMLCADHLVNQSHTCTVKLPPVATLTVNTSHGEIAIMSSDAAGSLVIQGKGSQIIALEGGSGNGRLLKVYATEGKSLNVHLSNMTVSNFGASSTTGGAMMLQGLSYGSMTDVYFYNNTGASGGALYVHESPSVTFLRCRVEENRAVEDGGGILVDSMSSKVRFEACIFEKNHVDSGRGGGLFIRDNNDDIVIDNCTFTHNVAIRGAGLNVNNYNYRMNLTAVLFLNNTSEDRGGGLSIFCFNYFFLMERCVLQSNTAMYKYGGAFYVYADNWYITVKDSEFADNVADLYGGAIDLYSNNDHAEFVNTKFLRNVGRHGGAGVDSYTDNDDMSFHHCDFIGNIAHIEGGGLFIGTSNDRYVVNNCNFWDNKAGSYGGALLLIRENYELLVSNCSFINCNSGSAGGAVHSSLLNSRMVFEECTFYQSGARLYGGALYFGEDHFDITFSKTNFTSNTADTGGALYISKFNSLVRIEDSQFVQNTAVFSGGAVVSFASQIRVHDSIFESNRASSAGALHSVSGTYGSQGFVGISSSCFRRNSASDKHGAVLLEFCRGCIIDDVRLEENDAEGLSGGLTIYNSYHFSIKATKFKTNKAGQTAGALYLLNVEGVTVENTTFWDNSAELGGAMYVQESKNVSVLNSGVYNNTAVLNAAGVGVYDAAFVLLRENNFAGNKAVTGSGSALHIMSSEVSMDRNYFRDNWSGQAGTVFWDYFSGMHEPEGLNSSDNIFSDSNVALYGPHFATQGVRMLLDDNNSYSVEDYGLPAPPIGLILSDYYHQTVSTENTAIVQVADWPSDCHDLDPYITGGITERFQRGVATFATMEAFCAAGYVLNIGFSTSLVTEHVSAVLEFRDCVRGEYFSERVCSECPVGSYSLVEPSSLPLSELTYEVCQPCPDYSVAKHCSGDDIQLQEGHWRISTLTDSILECPKDAPSCLGGSEAGDLSCGEGYFGPLCAVCDDKYYHSATTNTCEVCTEESSLVDPIFLTLVFAGLICLFLIGFFMYQRIKKAEIQTMDDLVIYLFFNAKPGTSDDPAAHKARAVNQSRSLRGNIKIYLTYFQIVATLPHILEVDFPQSFTAVISAASLLNLEIVQSSAVACSSSKVPDHIDILVVETIYPFVFALVIFCVAKLHVLWLSGWGKVELPIGRVMKIRSLYFSILLTFSYLILPHITAHVLSTFNCTDVDEGDAVDGKDVYMTADLSISCSSERYRFAVVWAVISIFLYPIGMPAWYFYLLYSHKEDIKNRHESLPTPQQEEERSLRTRPLRLLYDFYSPEFWYWEVVETLLRLSVTGFLVLFGPGSSLQATVGLLLALIYVHLYLSFKPFFNESLQKTKIATLWQLYFIFFFAFLIRADFVNSENIYIVISFLVLICASVVKNMVDFCAEKSAVISNFRQKIGDKMRQISRSGGSIEMDRLFADVPQSHVYSDQ